MLGPDKDREFVPVKGRDAAFSFGLSYDAGVGEEAFFRGYLMPLFRQHLGGSRWLANGLQAGLFAAAHRDFDPRAFAFRLGYGLYAGQLVNRRGGGLRQSVFTHFIWDLITVSGELLARQRDRRGASIGLSLGSLHPSLALCC